MLNFPAIRARTRRLRIGSQRMDRVRRRGVHPSNGSAGHHGRQLRDTCHLIQILTRIWLPDELGRRRFACLIHGRSVHVCGAVPYSPVCSSSASG